MDHLPLTNDLPNYLANPCEQCGSRDDKGDDALCNPCIEGIKAEIAADMKARAEEDQFERALEEAAERHVFERHGLEP